MISFISDQRFVNNIGQQINGVIVVITADFNRRCSKSVTMNKIVCNYPPYKARPMQSFKKF